MTDVELDELEEYATAESVHRNRQPMLLLIAEVRRLRKLGLAPLERALRRLSDFNATWEGDPAPPENETKDILTDAWQALAAYREAKR